LVPVSVDEVAAQGDAGSRFGSRAVLNGARRALLLRELATLLGAGLPIDEALGAMAERGSDGRTRGLVLGLRARVMEGASLAEAMADHPRSFPELYRASVAAGERSGKLAGVLGLLADEAESRDAMRQGIWAALAYPLLLAIVAVLVVSGLLIYVVPQIAEVFVRMHQDLPWSTRALLAGSAFLRAYGIWLLLLLIAVIAGIRLLLRGKVWRQRRDAWLLQLPGLGHLLKVAGTARATRTLALLTASAVPLLEALKITAKVIPNLAMRRSVEDAAGKVREGASLARALDDSGQFPPVALRLIAAGERAGALERMLMEASGYCSRQLERVLAVLTAVLGPALILVVGAMVLFIVLAILLPVFNLNQLVK
ncbi:MAG: type II secretion system F family protein, partial [Rhodanobacteraceae bacterium]